MTDQALQGVADTIARGKEPTPPFPWRLVQRSQDGCAWVNPGARLSVIWTCNAYDGELWFHVSVSHRDRIPKWEELVAVKEWSLGSEAWAYEVLAPRSRWININPHVLHLWSPANGLRRLPDFGAAGTL